MDDKIRVNRITVNINKKEDNTVISLYKTNRLLGTIDSDDLGIESFAKSKVSAKAYQAYCKDVVINLLDNGGINGYYYDPKEEKGGVKYGQVEFCTACMDYVGMVLGDKYNWRRNHDDKIVEVEQYNDKHIKNAKAIFGITIDGYSVNIGIVAEIKSGQMCRPRSFIYNGDEYTFNITTINKLIKSL